MAKKTPAPSDTADKFMLRLPSGMREKIKETAAKENRSMNAEIVAALEGWLNKPDREMQYLEALKLQAKDLFNEREKIEKSLSKILAKLDETKM